MAEHRREFDRQLDAIEAMVTELFAMICEDLPAVTQAVLNGNSEVAGPLAERERAIDALYREIEQLVSREILLQAPVASDLRFLLSVLRIAPELERSPRPGVPYRVPGRPDSRLGTVAALPRAHQADGRTCLRHVAPGRGLLVPAGRVRRVGAGRS